MSREDLAYRLGFGARRRAEVDAAYRARYAGVRRIRPPYRMSGRRGHRPRVYLRGNAGCLGCSVPLMVALAGAIAAVIWG